MAKPDTSRALAVISAMGFTLYVYSHLAHVPPEWRDRATQDQTRRVWVVVL